MKVRIVVTGDNGDVFEGETTLRAATSPARRRGKTPAINQPPPLAIERELNIVALVERLNDAKNFTQIETHVLNKSAVLPRLMLCGYMVREDASPYLSSGDMERITNQLNIKIFRNNIGHVLGKNLKYFTADSVRAGRGSRPKYKLSRQGITAFERLLAGGKL